VNRSKAKGTAWEGAIVDFLRLVGVAAAERRALGGNLDRGDIAGLPGVVIEAKAEKTFKPAEWLREARAERVNDGALIGVVWAKRVGKTSAADGYVIMEPETLVTLLRLCGLMPTGDQ
jgi:hypothetical protein